MATLNPQEDWNDWLAGHGGKFLLFARQLTRCLHDAEDVMQDALVECWKRIGGRPDPPLVFATIRRRAIDLGRSTSRREVRESRQEEPAHFTSTLEAAETSELLEQQIRTLPQPQREVLTLKFWGGLTFAEIATTLEIPAGTAASRYRLALDSLRQNLTALR